jgi:NADH:ubiquinone oxidoreductase subunit D
LGYLHRGVEKLAEGGTYHQFIPHTDRLDYVCACCRKTHGHHGSRTSRISPHPCR